MRLPTKARLGRRGLAGVVVVLVAAAGAGAWLLTRPPDAQAAQTVTATVARGTYQQTVSATGTLEPTRQADLDFAVSGRVTSVLVEAGDRVHSGQRLATLDTTSLDAALTSARAQLDAARAQYDDDVDADASSTQLTADTAAVAAAQSDLSRAEDDLSSATLRATMSGTVASVDLTVGDQVSGSSSNGSDGSDGATDPATSDPSNGSDTTTSQVVLVSPHHFKVVADVAADDVASVRKGMQAQLTPSGGSQTFYGTVTAVGLVAEASSSGAATFPVTVEVTGAQSKLYAGTSATVSIITKQVTGVLAVPAMALHTSGSTTYVEKLIGGKKVRTPVKVGDTYGSNTEVTSGLLAGDKVVLATIKLPTGNGTRNRGNLPGGGGNFPGGGNGPPSGNFVPPGGGNFAVTP